jgi:pyruvate kinase
MKSAVDENQKGETVARTTINTRLICTIGPASELPEVLLQMLNDGAFHREVKMITESDIECSILVGGELRSHKGVNLPGIAP